MFKELESMMDTLSELFVLAFVFITSPIWIVPYTAYKLIKRY